MALELGMTLVTGGWQTSPGRRTFMFMTPTMGSSNSGSGYLQFVSKVAELDDSELEAFFLDNMRVSGNETDQAGGFDAEDAASLFEGSKDLPRVSFGFAHRGYQCRQGGCGQHFFSGAIRYRCHAP